MRQAFLVKSGESKSRLEGQMELFYQRTGIARAAAVVTAEECMLFA